MMNELGGLAQYVVDNAGKLLCLIDIGGIRPNVARHIRIQRCQYKGSRFILVATPQIGVEYGGGKAVYGSHANFRRYPEVGRIQQWQKRCRLARVSAAGLQVVVIEASRAHRDHERAFDPSTEVLLL